MEVLILDGPMYVERSPGSGALYDTILELRVRVL